nr:P27 family phage terminase small subunit [Kitasatospora sp. SID7827]
MCQVCGEEKASLVHHFPRSREQLLSDGVRYPNAPARLRGICAFCYYTSYAAEVQEANLRCREVASAERRRIVPVLEVAAWLGEVDHSTVKDLCVCVARIDQAERDLSTRGLIVTAERGTVKNGAATIAAQYRSQLAR